ncbi:NAD(P)H-hydrate dehydratase [Methyloradius palustris]|uniref:ADP-dependent (S)-NAD(P)H-hydrate dehydratase n=1 Tax=Methyloradius palustris TaxID=2778876 RepID=A0A8D5G7F8_9PROT|nr:NAD(P)H-hydrate dehydratase [Methyloradius palustris]BCM24547.1 hypothetical protein ZMTM_08060 [Methyloradius palustris]
MNAINALPLLGRLKRKPDSHKGDYGKVLIIGGAAGMVGAPLLSGQAALHSGAGWVVIAFLSTNAPAVMQAQPEMMLRHVETIDFGDINPDVIAIGPGMGTSEQAKALLAQVFLMDVPLVIDADALNLLAADYALIGLLQKRKAPSVLTPHPGEAGRLLQLSNQAIQADRIASINALVKMTKAICVLKGSGSLVASPEHAPEICSAGNPGMATAGMGDVLTGVIAALIGQGVRNSLNVWDATRLAVLLHAMAADSLVNKGIGPIGLTALEVAYEVRQLVNHYAENASSTDTDGLAFLLDSP